MLLFVCRLQLAVLFLAISLSSDLMSQDDDDATPKYEGRFAGVVLDEDQKPIPNALVIADGAFNRKKFLVQTSTDGNGNFEFVLPPELLVREVANIWLWAYAPSKDVKCIKPWNSPQGMLDCRMQLQKESTIRLAIQEVDGKPGAGIECRGCYYEVPNGIHESATPTGLSAFVPELIAKKLSTKTDEDGIALIKGYPEGLLSSVYLSREGVLPQNHSLRSGHRELRLAKTGTVKGSVVSFDDLPIEGKKIHLSTDFSGEVKAFHECILDKNGEFKAEGFLVGNVAASLDWSPKIRKQPYLIGPQELSEGETIEFTIELVDAVRIEGRAVALGTSEGIPLARLAIDEEVTPAGRVSNSIGNNYYVETDEEGRYFAYVVPGSYSIQTYDITAWAKASDYNYPSTIRFQCRATDLTQTLEEIKASPVEQGTGRVDDADGKPIANRWIGFVSPTFGHVSRAGKTNSEGIFSFKIFANFDDKTGKWVVYPEGVKPRSLDARKLPALRVISDSPLELMEAADEGKP